MIRVKQGVDILKLLSSCGFTSYMLRQGKYFSQSSIQRLREGGLPSWRELDFVCNVTRWRIDELIEFIPDGSDFLEKF